MSVKNISDYISNIKNSDKHSKSILTLTTFHRMPDSIEKLMLSRNIRILNNINDSITEEFYNDNNH